MRRNVFLIILSVASVFALILVVAIVGQLRQRPVGDLSLREENPANVDPDQEEAPVLDNGKVQAACRLVPARIAQLSFSTSGLIETLSVAEGQSVSAGDVLARQDGHKQGMATIASAQRELDAAEQALTDLNEDVDLRVAEALKKYRDAEVAEKDAQKNLDRQKDANRSSAEIDQAEANLGLARATLRQAREIYEEIKNGAQPEEQQATELRLQEAQANLDAAEEAAAGRELKAPFSGKVIQVFHIPGEFAAPGTPILSLVDFGSLYVETTNLTELNVVNVKVGDPVEIVFDALPEATFTGVVDSIQPFGQKSLGDVTYTVKIKGDFLDRGILWGMTCSVSIGE